jgi:hypothetical protein
MVKAVHRQRMGKQGRAVKSQKGAFRQCAPVAVSQQRNRIVAVYSAIAAFLES